MAFKKAKTIKGHSNEYWRILQINTNFDRMDAVATFGLYKNVTTRNNDPNAVVDQYTIQLGEQYAESIYEDSNGGDERMIKNIDRAKAYEIFKTKAQIEADKPDEVDGETNPDKNFDLAWFADTTDA